MKIVIIDGQGGKVGKAVIEKIKASSIEAQVYAIGTNSIATSTMLKAGANFGATGENAVVVNCRDANIIVGPIGIVVADALLGEVTPQMAASVGQSTAKKVLLPINKCNNYVVGVSATSINEIVDMAIEHIKAISSNSNAVCG